MFPNILSVPIEYTTLITLNYPYGQSHFTIYEILWMFPKLMSTPIKYYTFITLHYL